MADQKLSQLLADSPADPLDGSEILEVTQDGATKGATIAQILAVAADAADDAIADAIAGLANPALAGVNVITEASAFTAVPATHSGQGRYVRAGGHVTFDSAEAYTTGMVFHLRATASIELVEDGVTITPEAGGTLEMTAGMSATIIMTSSTAADLIGHTVPA